MTHQTFQFDNDPIVDGIIWQEILNKPKIVWVINKRIRQHLLFHSDLTRDFLRGSLFIYAPNMLRCA